ncbi:hypothetical protein [Hydrogenophaga sp. OTU3427]|uniref:hypothetical protein n=1 Tax=Hydrogenophaga sp. OTU3427 TaxID=3043856 RepID=UPI00313D49FC
MKTTFTSRAALLASAFLCAPLLVLAAVPTQAEYTASKTAIGASYKTAKAACGSLKAHPKNVCIEEAKAKEKNERAELEFSHTGKAADGTQVKIVRAEGAYNVAKERCDAFRGNDKDVCVKEAKSVRVAALADAKVAQATAGARADAKEDVREAQYKVEVEKCDTQTGDGKTACIKAAKAIHGKP